MLVLLYHRIGGKLTDRSGGGGEEEEEGGEGGGTEKGRRRSLMLLSLTNEDRWTDKADKASICVTGENLYSNSFN